MSTMDAKNVGEVSTFASLILLT